MYSYHTYSEKPIAFESVQKLFKASYKQQLSEGYWRWRFLDNPIDASPRIAYAEVEGEIIAYYAVSPVPVIINGRTVIGALSNMTMTHPLHQGKGLFKELALTMFEELRRDGFLFVFGFANAKSHYGFRKNLGWKDLAILNMFSLEGLDRLQRDSLTMENIKIKRFGADEARMLSVSTASHAAVRCSRDEKQLYWRFVQHPEKEYFVASVGDADRTEFAIVYKYFNNSIDIMEIFDGTLAGNGLYRYFVSVLTSLAVKGVTSASIWSNLHSGEHLFLEKVGFKETGFMTYFGIVPLIDNLHLNVSDYRSWHYRYSDSDVY